LDANDKVKKVMAIYDQLQIEKETKSLMEELYVRAVKNLSGLSPGIMKIAKLKTFADELMGREN
jgi:geranylgeranyl pyrophosphate synthase